MLSSPITKVTADDENSVTGSALMTDGSSRFAVKFQRSLSLYTVQRVVIFSLPNLNMLRSDGKFSF